jgi:hypothetical protein
MNPKLRAALPTLLDIVIPVAGYFVLSRCGVSDFWALTVSGGVTALWALSNTLRRGRLDGVGTLVVAEIALSVVLLVATRDPRIVLLKPSFATALAGIYLLYTNVVGRPLVYETAKPFATQGDPLRAQAYENAWERNAGFRQEQRLINCVWGVVWLAESVARAVVVLNSSVAEGVWTSQIPGIAALVLGMVFTRLRVPRLRRYVDEQLALLTDA